jgi:hypothetical protein
MMGLLFARGMNSRLTWRRAVRLAFGLLSAALLELFMPASAMTQTLLHFEVNDPVPKWPAPAGDHSPAPISAAGAPDGPSHCSEITSAVATSELQLDESRRRAWPFIQRSRAGCAESADELRATERRIHSPRPPRAIEMSFTEEWLRAGSRIMLRVVPGNAERVAEGTQAVEDKRWAAWPFIPGFRREVAEDATADRRATASAPRLQSVALRQSEKMDQGATPYQIQVALPAADQLFRLETDQALQARIKRESSRPGQEARTFPENPERPEQGPTATTREWPLRDETAEPNYVCHGRLLFDDENSERFGWDLGFIQPFVSTGIFFFDFATLPYHYLALPPWPVRDCSAGRCLPGDPTPYRLVLPCSGQAGTDKE